MSEYPGTFEMRPQYDGRKSFHGKPMIERRDTANGMIYAPRPYGTTVATVTPTGAWGAMPETCGVKAATGPPGATTLRHVKEFLTRTDDVFRGITLDWPRRAVKDGRRINGAVRGPVCRRTFTMGEP